jgi:DNA repair exonuclease SbcCD ATPase subunit
MLKMEITQLFDKLFSQVSEKRTAYKLARTQYETEKENLERAKASLAAAEQARDIIQEVAQQLQREVHHRIAGIVTLGLKTVFDNPYTFKINFEKKRGRTEAEMLFERDGVELDPFSSAGGGVIDVAAFALRVACLSLSKPSLRPILILDEPFKNVSKSKGYLDQIPALLEKLSEELGLRIIMVTHIEELKVGKVIDLEELKEL